MKALFVDIGGVLLTNGWDRNARARAATEFHLEPGEMEERHHLTFATYEAGKITLDEYLNRVIFHKKRSFTHKQFRDFMFAQSSPFPEVIEFFRSVKSKYKVRVAAVSNEGRELTEHRIATFNLAALIDVFICSCFVHVRKPDHDIYHIALDVAQVPPGEAVYIDDRLMFVQIAENLGLRGIHHTSLERTAHGVLSWIDGRDRLAGNI